MRSRDRWTRILEQSDCLDGVNSGEATAPGRVTFCRESTREDVPIDIQQAFQSPLGIRLQAIQLSPYRAGLAEPSLQRVPTGSASTACFGPVGLSPAGKPLTQGSVAPNTLLSAKGINYAPTRRTPRWN